MGKLKFNKRWLAVVVGCLLILSGVSASQSERIAGWVADFDPGYYQVTEVNDGDTITVDMSGKAERVRLIGIDTPELHHPQKPVQCFAEEAKTFVTDLIDGNKVKLIADPEDDNRDLYGRLLRYVYLPDGTHVNAEIVRQGYGFAYTHFPFIKIEEMRRFELEAREQNRGLWGGCQVKDSEEGRETAF